MEEGRRGNRERNRTEGREGGRVRTGGREGEGEKGIGEEARDEEVDEEIAS